jgi:hypothetical protein
VGWRILLAIVFSVASAIPLAGQEPLATQTPFKQASFKQPPLKQPPLKQPPLKQPPLKQPPFKQPSFKPTQTRGGDDRGLSDADWVKILGTLVAFGVVAFIVHSLKRPPKVEVVSVKDKDYYGEQHVAPSQLVLAVELCPVLDPGDQELDKVGPLVEQRGG